MVKTGTAYTATMQVAPAKGATAKQHSIMCTQGATMVSTARLSRSTAKLLTFTVTGLQPKTAYRCV